MTRLERGRPVDGGASTESCTCKDVDGTVFGGEDTFTLVQQTVTLVLSTDDLVGVKIDTLVDNQGANAALSEVATGNTAPRTGTDDKHFSVDDDLGSSGLCGDLLVLELVVIDRRSRCSLSTLSWASPVVGSPVGVANGLPSRLVVAVVDEEDDALRPADALRKRVRREVNQPKMIFSRVARSSWVKGPT